MSSNIHKCSNPGVAKYCSKSCNLGMGSWGFCNVRCWLTYSHVQSAIFSSLPKHRFKVASWGWLHSVNFSLTASPYSHGKEQELGPWSSGRPSLWHERPLSQHP